MGEVNTVGLTTSAITLQFGEAEIWDQDQSIMGWTCGFGIASARDVAKFYYDLLGPSHKILTQESIDLMSSFSTLDRGWESGYIDYGGGLFVINASPRGYRTPSLDDNGTYVGHEGDTYGF